MDDYALMCAPSTVDQLRDTLVRLEQRWKTIRQRPKNRPTSISPALRPPSPLLRAYSEIHVDSNVYATPPTARNFIADGDPKILPSRASSPELMERTSDGYGGSSYSTPQKKKIDPDFYDSPASIASSSNLSRPYAGTSRLPIAPGRRVGALTRENVSRLPQYPHHSPLDRDAGSVCSSQSNKSRMSVKTDGGGVFSRLYKPSHLQDRDLRMAMHKERQQFNLCPFMPKTNSRSRTPSVASRDSFCSASSCTSVQTDITPGLSASSRLYDPDYIRKRHAKLEKLREERELRECTFTPTVNKSVNAKLLNRENRASSVQVTSINVPQRNAGTRRIK